MIRDKIFIFVRLMLLFSACGILSSILFLFLNSNKYKLSDTDKTLVPIKMMDGREFDYIILPKFGNSNTRFSVLNKSEIDKKTGSIPTFFGFLEDINLSDEKLIGKNNIKIITRKSDAMRKLGISSIRKDGVFFVITKKKIFSKEIKYIYTPDEEVYKPTKSKSRWFSPNKIKRVSKNWFSEE